MSDIVITWGMLTLPDFFLQRVIVAALGFGGFLHFLCMASAAPPHTPWLGRLFLLTIGFSLIGMGAAAMGGDIGAMRGLVLAALCAVFLFYLWLWGRGMHVRDYLDRV